MISARRLILIVATAAPALLPGLMAGACAATQASAVATVTVRVEPHVRVEAVAHAVELGDVPVGEFPATVTFRVSTNARNVALYVRADDLESADGAVAMPVSRGPGVVVGRDGLPHAVPWESDAAAGLTSSRIEWSPDGGREETYVTITWRRDAEQPAGRYRARVTLTALVMPE